MVLVLFFTHIPFAVNHNINATPPERLQQHPLLFTTNHTDRTFFLWRLNSARPSHPGHSTLLLQSEIRAACTQIFAPRQQATIEIMLAISLAIACSFLLDFETLQQTKFSASRLQRPVAARNDVIAKILLADCFKTSSGWPEDWTVSGSCHLYPTPVHWHAFPLFFVDFFFIILPDTDFMLFYYFFYSLWNVFN